MRARRARAGSADNLLVVLGAPGELVAEAEITIHPFLNAGFAQQVANAYPTFEQSRVLGFEFAHLNEHRKVQITDSTTFPPAMRRVADQLASPQFLADLEYITGIPRPLADPKLEGGGMHLTGPGGRLDVHVDFNYLADRKLYRRLNILVYVRAQTRSCAGAS